MNKKHVPLHMFRLEQQAKVDFAFCFVRRPHAWLESVWRWLRPQRGHRCRFWGREDPVWHPFAPVARLFDDDFNVWARRVLEREPAYATRTFEMFAGPPNGRCVNFVGRVERIEDDLAELCDRLGLPRVEGSDARRNRKPGRVSWDPGLRRLLEATERPTHERWY